MDQGGVLRANMGGFNFDNCLRNAMLQKQGMKPPRAQKTGTTIAGVVFKNGIVLGADTRATAGPIVADKNCAKIHYIAPNIYCCGAGVSADTENVTGMVSSQLELLRLNTNCESRVITAMTHLKRHLFRYQGHVTAALVLGGVDCTGPSLWTVHPHGSTDRLPFVTMGSGSLAAMSIFESRYRDDMDRKEAIEMVRDAIRAGIFNDLGSGSNVDLTVITADGVEYLRNFETPNERPYVRQLSKVFPPGSTEYLTEKVRNLAPYVETRTISAASSSMDM